MHEHFPDPEPLGFGFAIRPLDPESDAETVHRWTRESRARFWGMEPKGLEEIREIYAWIADSSTHHAYMVSLDGQDVAVFQTYDPAHDEVGEAYPSRPGDLGVHLMVAPREECPPSAAPSRGGPGLTTALLGVLAPAVVARTGARRIIGEPDARNRAAIERLRSFGFELGDQVWLEGQGKTAQIAVLDVAPSQPQA